MKMYNVLIILPFVYEKLVFSQRFITFKIIILWFLLSLFTLAKIRL